MKPFIFALGLILLLVVSAVPVSAVPTENEYGIVNAWFNGKEATVKNVTLKIGEPAEIKVVVNSKIDGDVYLSLTNPLVTEPYKVLNGPSEIEKTISNEGVSAGWSTTYIWTLSPNGAWKNGNAPINIFVQIFKGSENKKIEFSVADPYILDEQYEGPISAPQTSAATEAPKADSSQQDAPFPYFYLILIGAAVIIILVLFKMKKK